MSLVSFLLLGVCCGIISYTIAKGSIFGPLREWFIMRSLWLGKLVTCPLCLSHWVAIGAMMIYHPCMIGSGSFVDYVVTGFSLAGLSALFAATIFKLFWTPEG